jgi:hypothetical protein
MRVCDENDGERTPVSPIRRIDGDIAKPSGSQHGYLFLLS